MARVMTTKKLVAWIGANVVCIGIWLVLFLNGKEVHHENGPMENVQLAGLAVATVIFGNALWKAAPGPQKLFCMSLFWLGLNFTIRETKIRGEQYPQLLVELLDDPWRIVWLGAVWLVLFILFLRNRQAVWLQFRSWLRSPAGMLMIAAGACFLSSIPFDQEWFKSFGLTRTWDVFLEEAPDSVASLLILFAAIETVIWVRRRQAEARGPV
jgi:hypothetical protein